MVSELEDQYDLAQAPAKPAQDKVQVEPTAPADEPAEVEPVDYYIPLEIIIPSPSATPSISSCNHAQAGRRNSPLGQNLVPKFK